MPRLFQMSDLRLRCQRRCDMENDASISTAEWHALMSEVYGEIYEAVADTGLRYFENATRVTTTGLGYLSEPANHLATVDTIERITNTTTDKRQRLYPLQAQERAAWSGRTGHARKWEFVDDRINLYPTPPSGDIYELRYVPQPPDLTSFVDASFVDVVCAAGEAALLWGVAIPALGKSKSDVTLALTMKGKALERLVNWATERLMSQPQRVYVEDEEDIGSPLRDGEWRYDR